MNEFYGIRSSKRIYCRPFSTQASIPRQHHTAVTTAVHRDVLRSADEGAKVSAVGTLTFKLPRIREKGLDCVRVRPQPKRLQVLMKRRDIKRRSQAAHGCPVLQRNVPQSLMLFFQVDALPAAVSLATACLMWSSNSCSFCSFYLFQSSLTVR